MRLITKLLLALFGALVVSASFSAQSAETGPDYDAMAKSAVAMVGRMIEADTTSPPGNEARVARLVAKRLEEAGIPYEITEFAPGRENIVARLKASGTPTGKPLLLLSHEDVVTAAGQNWSTDPHKLTPKDGALVGRGVSDDLGMGAVDLEVFLQLKKSGAALKRDVILALTGDEEYDALGIRYLLEHKKDSIDAGIALNEGGGILLDPSGKPEEIDLSAAEKTYQDFELTAAGATGHSSVPLKDNAIYRLARALGRLETNPEGPRLLPVTRAYFAARAAVEKPPLSDAMKELGRTRAGARLPAKALKVIEADPSLAALLRTTCVATLIKGGTRVNALPADASANVNCRILPDESPRQILARLEKIVADPQVRVRLSRESGKGPASPVDGEAMRAIEKVTDAMWPGLPIVPSLMKGASDSRFLRQAGISAYGINPLPMSEADERRMHGIDERVPATSFRTGVEFMHRLVLELAGS
jgi:acetylornithine deacetylase/succinyl-diaminopimelate desuccinylase-like protein